MVNFKNLTITKKLGTKARAKFIVSPLPEGYGATLGNSLRRVLLSSLEGAAIYQAKFKGVTHRFTTVKGVKEDVVELLLNIQNVRLKMEVDNPQVLTLKVSKAGEIKASAIDTPAGVEIVNKDLHLATLQKGAVLEAEFMAQKGFGFVPSEGLEISKVGVLGLDALYSPVSKVAWSVEKTRVGDRSNLDKLVLDITTDNTIAPKDALVEASAVLRDFFTVISKDAKAPMSEAESEEIVRAAPLEENADKNLKLDLEEISAIPSRTVNALKKAHINTVSDVLERDWDELLAVKNMGKKSVAGLEELFIKEGFLKKEEEK